MCIFAQFDWVTLLRRFDLIVSKIIDSTPQTQTIQDLYNFSENLMAQISNEKLSYLFSRPTKDWREVSSSFEDTHANFAPAAGHCGQRKKRRQYKFRDTGK